MGQVTLTSAGNGGSGVVILRFLTSAGSPNIGVGLNVNRRLHLAMIRLLLLLLAREPLIMVIYGSLCLKTGNEEFWW
jgi:hypothetical protein